MWQVGISLETVKLIYECYLQAISCADINGRLPIHYLFDYDKFFSEKDLATNKLRFILSKCPDCASIPDSSSQFKTAYQLSLSEPTFVQRLVLRAKPDMNLQLYRELNYTARRMGMFLGFKAKTENNAPLMFSCMRLRNMDVFRVIMSFL